MKLNKEQAVLYVPDSQEDLKAVERTTALCIAAHHDDIEIMAYHPIVQCFGKGDQWFAGVVVTDGAGSPRTGVYESYTDEDMKSVRAEEQKMAAKVGKYGAQFLLAYPSAEVKDSKQTALRNELSAIIEACAPEIVYTHNLADKHDTHVATALRTIEAIRQLPVEKRPKKLIALEVWRGLDWLNDTDKVILDTAGHPNLAAALLGVFDSQIAGGKRYDLAALGRRTANATFLDSHFVDTSESVTYGLDLTPLIESDDLSPVQFITNYTNRFEAEIQNKIERFL